MPRNEKTFDKLVKETLTAAELEQLKHELGSPHMRTKILARPEVASNDQLLLFSQLLDIPAYRLYKEYSLGKDNVTTRELQQHKLIYKSINPHSAPNGRAVQPKSVA